METLEGPFENALGLQSYFFHALNLVSLSVNLPVVVHQSISVITVHLQRVLLLFNIALIRLILYLEIFYSKFLVLLSSFSYL